MALSYMDQGWKALENLFASAHLLVETFRFCSLAQPL